MMKGHLPGLMNIIAHPVKLWKLEPILVVLINFVRHPLTLPPLGVLPLPYHQELKLEKLFGVGVTLLISAILKIIYSTLILVIYHITFISPPNYPHPYWF